MSAHEDKVITLLQSIDWTMKAMLSSIRESMEKREAARQAAPAMSGGMGKPSGITVASDQDLDSQYGDPIIKMKDPRDWTGPSMIGLTFSQCPAEYLDLVADRLDYFASKAEEEGKTTSAGKPVAPYNRKDAARARGWALRVRAGKVKQNNDDDSGADEPPPNF